MLIHISQSGSWKLVAACILWVSMLILARPSAAAEGKSPVPSAKSYSGTSEKGNFAEALQAAVDASVKEMPCCERMLEWKLDQVTGVRGGIARFNKITVTIEAQVK